MGRPRIYESVEEIDKAIEEYFFPMVYDETETDTGVHRSAEYKGVNRTPTVTGLALALGFADKTTLYEYRDRPEFSYSIKRALTKIEQYHEEGLSSNNVAGRIFALKNMGWKDKSEQDINAKIDGGVNIVFKKAETFETK